MSSLKTAFELLVPELLGREGSSSAVSSSRVCLVVDDDEDDDEDEDEDDPERGHLSHLYNFDFTDGLSVSDFDDPASTLSDLECCSETFSNLGRPRVVCLKLRIAFGDKGILSDSSKSIGSEGDARSSPGSFSDRTAALRCRRASVVLSRYCTLIAR